MIFLQNMILGLKNANELKDTRRKTCYTPK